MQELSTLFLVVLHFIFLFSRLCDRLEEPKIDLGCVNFVVSGVFADSGNAEQQVSLGVAVYTGTTVLYLTLLWGMCVIFGRTEYHENYSSKVQGTEASTSKSFPKRGKLSFLTGFHFILFS